MPQVGSSAVQRTMNAYHARLLAMEAEQMREMAKRWLSVEASLEARISALSMQIAMLHAENRAPLRTQQFLKLEHYRALLGQVRTEVQRYNAWATDLITKKQGETAKLGIQGSQSAIDATYRDAGMVRADYHRLPVKAVEEMIGMAGDGSPLSDLFRLSYPQAALELTQALVNAVSRGDNPRETARVLRDAMAGNLQRALVIARTEQLRAFRTASLEQMKQSGVVDGWIWRSALQDRTCPACLAMDGSEHTFDEQLDDHPQGRCWMQPMIKGMQPVQAESGKDWFERQEESTKRTILGKDKFEAWKDGKFEFSVLAGRRDSEEWGTTVKIKSLEELLSSSFDKGEKSVGGIQINADRQAHWESRHPETLDASETILKNAILNPSQITDSKSNPNVKINYSQDHNGNWWAVVITYPRGKKPYVLTFRRAHGPGK